MAYKKPILQWLAISILISITAWHWGQAASIYLKAHLAQWLISHAWQQTLATGINTKPWAWADTWPVAKIKFDDKTFYVLAGSAGNSLAFGPGHVSNTALPGTYGASVIGGHRDTHFSRLRGIKLNDTIQLQNQKGVWQHYRVTDYWVAENIQQPLIINKHINTLYLITCYPFDTFNPNSDQRFVVKATPLRI